MPTARIQPSFAGGVLGPGLQGRTDIAKYDVGLKTAKNMFIHVHGGISNRAGSRFIAEVSDHNVKHRLVSFERSAEENHLLVFGDTNMRVIDNDAYVLDTGVPYEVTSPYTAAQAEFLSYAQSVDVHYLAHPEVPPKKLSRLAIDNWTFADIATNPTATPPTAVTVTPLNAGSKTYRYVVTALDDNGVEGLPSASGETTTAENLDVEGAEVTISWTSAASEFNIYREINGVYSYVGFASGTTSFTDENVLPDITTNPPISTTLFSAVDDYPSVVTFFQQRLVLAASNNEPETIWPSQTGDFENFTRSRTIRATDSVPLGISGRQINTVRGMINLRELLVFSSSAEFAFSGPSGVFDITNPVQRQFGELGSSVVEPLIVNDTALIVDRTGSSIHDLRYAFEQDGYNGRDISILASHFFKGKNVAGWDFALNPDSIVWVYLDDGTLLSLTYEREQQVWAWSEHDVGGAVESLAIIPRNNYDAVYIIVRRTIDGQTKRYIECIGERQFEDIADAFFVDSGITYDGAATTTITGLDHLEGEPVVALADGVVIPNLTVSSGQVTLPNAASKVHVGLEMVAEFETLPPAVEIPQTGAARGKFQSISEVQLQLEGSRGYQIGPDLDSLREPASHAGDLALAPQAFTGITDPVQLTPDWSRRGTVSVRQPYPLPLTVLAIIAELRVAQ